MNTSFTSSNKRLITIISCALLTICLLLGLCYSTIRGDDSVITSGDFTYTVTDGKATITSYTGTDTSVTIPSTIDSIPVIAIGDECFMNNEAITSVVIEDGIEIIGDYAFHCNRPDYSSSITSITLPNTLTTIGDHAFDFCWKLTSLSIPNSVTSIGSYAFKNCNKVTSFTLPSSITSIPEGCFQNCGELVTLNLNNTITSIGDYAFSTCQKLKQASFELLIANTTYIGDEAFYNCNSITSVTLPSSLQTIGKKAFNGCFYLTTVTLAANATYEADVFTRCSKLVTANIPVGMTAIPEGIFSSCIKLAGIEIPNTVVTIGDRAFASCGLLSLNLPSSVTTIGANAFYGCKFTMLSLPGSITSIGESAFSNCSNLNNVMLLSNASIGNNAFRFASSALRITTLIDSPLYDYCIANSIKYASFSIDASSGTHAIITGYEGTEPNVTIPNNYNGIVIDEIGANAFEGNDTIQSVVSTTVTNIGSEAFAECENLETVYSSCDYNSIGDYAFLNCTSLASFNVANKNINSIGKGAFMGCSSFTIFTIPSTVTVIEESTFENCTGLASISIPEGIQTIGDRAFFGCSGLTTITLPTTLTTIGNTAFGNCFELTSIVIPESVQTLGECAFVTCYALEEVTLPSSITTIGSTTFLGTSITEIVIPNSVTTIGENAFAYTPLENVTLSTSLISIGDNAFEGTNISTITLPDGLTHIGDRAFLDSGLEEINIPDSVTYIGEEAFCACNLESLTIPESVTTIGNDAFLDCYNIVLSVYYNSVGHTHAVNNNIEHIVINPPTPTPTATPTATPTSTPTATPTSAPTVVPTTAPGAIPPATGNTVDRSAAEAFVTRCYELVLGRSPDPTGLNNWVNSLVNNQNTGAHMAYGFFFSQEYINSNTSNEEFVTTLYNVFLDRAPDQGGLNDWVGQLEAGATREQIFAGVANSREFFALCNSYGITAGHYIQGIDNTRQQNVNAFVARLYSMCLGRNGDYDGQASWVRQLIYRENSGAGVAYGFFFSPEFINRNLTNEEYAATLYRVFLGREPDQAGFNDWVSQLNNGADRLSTFRGFAHSQEYTNICNSYGIERGTI